MKKKLLFIGFYELKEHLLHISQLFIKYNYDVYNYPLFQYAYDSNDKLETYDQHLNDFIKKNGIEIVLWWFLDVPINVFRTIKNENPDIYYILYNTDDPINFNEELVDKASIFNLIITPCRGNVHKYKIFTGNNNVYYYPHCYDPTYFFRINNVECDDDISMIIYNHYDKNKFKYQYIEIGELISKLITYCKNNLRKLSLYGSYVLKELYGEYYKGYVDYKKQNELFNKSKINIFVRCTCETDMVISDIEVKILASGSLLCVDKFNGMKDLYEDNINCIVLDKKNYINQIDEILNKYNYEHIKQNAIKSVNKYTWEYWVIEIHKHIMGNYFNANVYKNINGLDIKIENAWNHWINIGLNKNYICHDFNIPKNFDYEFYRDFKKIESQDIKYLYYDWYNNSKDNIFFKKNDKTTNIDINDFHCTMEIYYDICSILNKVKEYNTRDEGLMDLVKKCNNNPNIKLNKIIEKYFENI